jgi:hypothetical protein
MERRPKAFFEGFALNKAADFLVSPVIPPAINHRENANDWNNRHSVLKAEAEKPES